MEELKNPDRLVSLSTSVHFLILCLELQINQDAFRYTDNVVNYSNLASDHTVTRLLNGSGSLFSKVIEQSASFASVQCVPIEAVPKFTFV